VREVLYCLGAVLVFLLLFVFPHFAARFIVRRFGGSPERDAGSVLTCPRCGSAGVARLEANRVTPFPGYECQECGVQMRPPGTGVFYAVVLAVAVGLIALFTTPLWYGGDGEPRVVPFTLVVAGYAVYQLRRPTPRRSRRP
jgi:hypothetical protein